MVANSEEIDLEGFPAPFETLSDLGLFSLNFLCVLGSFERKIA